RFFRVKNTLDPEEIEYFTNVDYHERMALVAIAQDRFIGVGRYDALADDPSTAEVAFAVADDHQVRGVGTELLLLLTSYALNNAIKRLQAYVLPENRQMMQVFRNSGFELNRSLEEGMYPVDVPGEESESSVAAGGEKERRAVTASPGP